MGFWSQLFGSRRQSQAVLDCLDAFPFALEVAPGKTALARLEELRSPDFCPVILGDADSLLARHARLQSDSYTVTDIQQRVASIGTPEWWFTARAHALEEQFEAIVGDWPEDVAPHNTVHAVLDPETGAPMHDVFLTRLPTRHSWDAPVLLRFGGWDDSPFPEEHAAIAHAWHEQYGADIIAVTQDTLEFAVANPPTTREAAEELAMNHFAYCEELVVYHAKTIRTLAASLLNAPTWFFWWERKSE